ncbi:vWA domain-containing protein [Roseiconus lacunae]|uniref:vWA domain-containing protein n=1 Tax=Roseiconus lacunae TaxID=2605694 RepID=UPI0030878B12|nr:vWA domain-containing protein [Stieleria sp. HD01]
MVMTQLAIANYDVAIEFQCELNYTETELNELANSTDYEFDAFADACVEAKTPPICREARKAIADVQEHHGGLKQRIDETEAERKAYGGHKRRPYVSRSALKGRTASLLLCVWLILAVFAGTGTVCEVSAYTAMVQSGTLLEQSDPTSPTGILEPSFLKAFSFSFAAIFGSLAGIEFLAKLSPSESRRRFNQVLGASLLFFAQIAVWLSAYFVTGPQEVFEIAGVMTSPSTPPFYVFAVQMTVLSLINAVLMHWLWKIAMCFVEFRSVTDDFAVKSNALESATLTAEKATSETVRRLRALVERAENQKVLARRELRSKVKEVKDKREGLRLRNRGNDMLGGAALLFLMAFATGCGVSGGTEQAGRGGLAPQQPWFEEPVQYLIVDAQGHRHPAFRDNVDAALTYGLPAGSKLTIVEGPQHRLAVSFDVPPGAPEARIRQPIFAQQYHDVETYFDCNRESKAATNEEWLPMYSVARVLRDLGNGDLPFRVLMVGSPIYHSDEFPAYSMSTGLYPSDGCFTDDPAAPFSIRPGFPPDTQITFLTDGSNWGTNERHIDRVTRFQRLCFGRAGAHIVRITSDPDVAFSFVKPHFGALPKLRYELPGMIESKVPVDLDKPKSPQKRTLPVRPGVEPPPPPGSVLHKIQEAGGSATFLAERDIAIYLLYDGSGSMGAYVQRANVSAEEAVDKIAPLVRSFKIGAAVYRSSGTEKFPMTRIDSDGSSKRFKSFLSSVQATASDGDIGVELDQAMDQLASCGGGTKQILMVVADCVHLKESGFLGSFFGGNDRRGRTIDAIRTWANTNSTDRTVVAYFPGGTSADKQFFTKLGGANPSSRFTETPEALIDALIQCAVPTHPRRKTPSN